jgi:DNA-directed RNA polymerase specialized sigma24 family protein
MPLPDVAAELGIPLGTAKSRLHRSLGVMRTTLLEADAGDRESVQGGQPA